MDDEIEEGEAIIQELDKQLGEKEAEKKEWNKQKTELEDEILVLAAYQEQLEEKATKLKNNLDIERAEHQNLYRLYLDKEKEVSDLTNDRANLNAEIATKNMELNEKDDRITDLSNEVDNLNDILIRERNDFANELTQKDTEIRRWTNDYNQLQTDKNQEITATKNLLTTEQANHQATTQALADEQAARTTEKTNTDKEIANLKVSNDNYKKNYEQEKALREEQDQQITNLTTELTAKDNQIQDLQTQLANTKANESHRITQELNSSLGLNLPPETSLPQTITIIKELIAPPTVIDNTQHQATENPLEFLATVKTEDLEWLKEVLSQQLYTIAKQKLTNQDFTSYSQLAEVRNSLVNQQFSQSANKFQLVSQTNNSLIRQKNILWLLLAIGLLGVAIITGKLRTSQTRNKKYANNNKNIKEELSAMRKEMRIFMATMLNNKAREI